MKHTEQRLHTDSEFPGTIWTQADDWVASTLVEAKRIKLAEDYAAELVRRWNSNDALLEACKAFVRWVDDCWGASEILHPDTLAEYEAAKAAIKLAEEA